MNTTELHNFVRQKTHSRAFLIAQKEEMRQLKDDIAFYRFSRGFRQFYYITKHAVLILAAILLVPLSVILYVSPASVNLDYADSLAFGLNPAHLLSFLCLLLSLLFLYLAWLTRILRKRSRLLSETEEQTLHVIASCEALIETLEEETRQLEIIVNDASATQKASGK